MKKLSSDEIQRALQTVNGWQLKGETIQKSYKFADFLTAMKFMNLLAPKAEELQHHPDWSNVYNRVSISLTTHDAGGLTEVDFQFAAAADDAAERVTD